VRCYDDASHSSFVDLKARPCPLFGCNLELGDSGWRIGSVYLSRPIVVTESRAFSILTESKGIPKTGEQ